MVVNTIEGALRVYHRVMSYRTCNGFTNCQGESFTLVRRPTCKHGKDGYFFMALAVRDKSIMENSGNLPLYMAFYERDDGGCIDWTEASRVSLYGTFNIFANKIVSTSPNEGKYGN